MFNPLLLYLNFLGFVCACGFSGASSFDVYRPDTQRIFVDVGLGFHVEFTWSEALKFISLREEKLERYMVFLQSIKQPCLELL